MDELRKRSQKLLELAGVTLNGSAPYDIEVKDEAVYRRIFAQGTLGFAESYMDGQWECEDLAELMHRLLRAQLQKSVGKLSTFVAVWRAKLLNLQTSKRAYQVGKEHYDLGNDLYERMLGRRMVYTCGYWSSSTTPAHTLDDAQGQKLDLICRKIGLKAGDTVLDIGCGWGSFLKFAAEKYGVKGVGITVSKKQAELAQERCKGLPVEIRVEDYRSTKGQFDHVISIGMFEHVGPKNYRTYFAKAHELLKDGGIFLLHTIGGNRSTHTTEAFIEKYIFPNGVIPSAAQIGAGIDGLFVIEDWHNFGPDYDKTLCAWFANFDKHWPELKAKYGERFYRMWKYYLLSCAGGFRARNLNLWQIVLTKNGIEGGYKTVR